MRKLLYYLTINHQVVISLIEDDYRRNQDYQLVAVEARNLANGIEVLDSKIL